MQRVKIGPAVPDRETLAGEIACLHALDIGELRSHWHTARNSASIFARRRATVGGFIASSVLAPADAAMLGLIPPSAGHVSLMPRVKIGPALPGRETVAVEVAQLRDLDIGDLYGSFCPPHRHGPGFGHVRLQVEVPP